MLSLFSFLGRLRQGISGGDKPSQPRPDERIDELPLPTIDEPSPPPTIDPESSGPDASRTPSPSVLASGTRNASEIPSCVPPVASIPTIDPKSSGPDASQSPSSSILALVRPDAKEIPLCAPPVASIASTDPEPSEPDASWSPSPSILALVRLNASEISLCAPPVASIPTIDPEPSGRDASRSPSPSIPTLVRQDATEISSWAPPVASTPTIDPKSSGSDGSWSPSPSILALPTPNASAISLWAPSVASGSVATSPRDRPEIFVDASGSGIGVILNKRWLAWTFTPNHPDIPVGRNNSIISSWAELIAAELGLLTALAAGYRDTTIKLKSDNRGVVKAITKRRWGPKHELDVILQRVLSLSEDSGLTLKVGWVLGVRNPADKPSRGKYPPRALMLDYCPEVPHYLAGMIQPVDPSSLRQ